MFMTAKNFSFEHSLSILAQKLCKVAKLARLCAAHRLFQVFYSDVEVTLILLAFLTFFIANVFWISKRYVVKGAADPWYHKKTS